MIKNIYYTKEGNIYLVPNHYSNTLEYIDKALEYAKEIGLTVPERSEIRIEILRSNRHNKMLSIEFKSKTLPNEDIGFELSPG